MGKYLDGHGSELAMMNDYKDYCFANFKRVVDDNIGKADFMASWSKEVADHFNLSEEEVAASYGEDDKYSTDMRTRNMWKYGAMRGVFGTPTVFINGSMLDSVPATVSDWLKVLDGVKASQYQPTVPPMSFWLQ